MSKKKTPKNELKENHLTENLEILGLGLWIKSENSLILSDLHLGYESNLRKSGYLVPKFQYKKITKKLEQIFKSNEHFSKIIITGDVKHSFGSIPQQEWSEILKMIDFLLPHADELILIKGNHDSILSPIVKKRNVTFCDLGYFLNGYYFTHGHLIPEDNPKFKQAHTIIIGNEHPALGISDGTTTETVKCFLKGKWKNKELIVLPSFCQATTGIDILKNQILSPYLKQNLGKFEVWVTEPEALYFGKIKDLEKRNSALNNL